MPVRVASLITCALITIALLSGCTQLSQSGPSSVTTGTSPGATPAASSEPSPSASTLSPSSFTPETNCPEDPEARIVTLVVTTDDLTAPVEIAYAAFQTASKPAVHTVTGHGPVITMQERFCGDSTAEQGHPWVFTASTHEQGDLSCAVFWGGRLMQTANDTTADSDTAADLTADCSSHPGM